MRVSPGKLVAEAEVTGSARTCLRRPPIWPIAAWMRSLPARRPSMVAYPGRSEAGRGSSCLGAR